MDSISILTPSTTRSTTAAVAQLLFLPKKLRKNIYDLRGASNVALILTKNHPLKRLSITTPITHFNGLTTYKDPHTTPMMPFCIFYFIITVKKVRYYLSINLFLSSEKPPAFKYSARVLNFDGEISLTFFQRTYSSGSFSSNRSSNSAPGRKKS